MGESSMKTRLVQAIGSGSRPAESNSPYDPLAVMDDNATDAYLAFSMYFSPEEENNIQI